MEEKNNKVTICGEILSKPLFSHEIYGEKFLDFQVGCKRLSGNVDVLPITISERLLNEQDFNVGSIINAKGQLRSYNKEVDGKSKLMLTIFITEIVKNDNCEHCNEISLNGFICKEPIYRTTPFNREITDILIAVNRAYKKSDYIPCIAWGRNARFVNNLKVGENIALSGRIQSRQYQKQINENEIKTMTTYEISISKLYYNKNLNNLGE